MYENEIIQTVFECARYGDDDEVLRSLLQNDIALVNATDGSGNTPLHFGVCI